MTTATGLGTGLLTGQIGVAEGATDKTGTALYLGLRYDLPSKNQAGCRVQPRLEELDLLSRRLRRCLDLQGRDTRQRV